MPHEFAGVIPEGRERRIGPTRYTGSVDRRSVILYSAAGVESGTPDAITRPSQGEGRAAYTLAGCGLAAGIDIPKPIGEIRVAVAPSSSAIQGFSQAEGVKGVEVRPGTVLRSAAVA